MLAKLLWAPQQLEVGEVPSKAGSQPGLPSGDTF